MREFEYRMVHQAISDGFGAVSHRYCLQVRPVFFGVAQGPWETVPMVELDELPVGEREEIYGAQATQREARAG